MGVIVMSEKLNIFDILGQLDDKNYDFYQIATSDVQKQIVPLVLMRWMTGTKNEQQIMFLNEFVNPVVFALYSHPILLWKLMCICSPGRRSRYQWTKIESKNSKVAIDVVKEYFKYSTREAIGAVKLLSPSDILSCAIELGYESAKLTKLKKELK